MRDVKKSPAESICAVGDLGILLSGQGSVPLIPPGNA